MEYHQNRYARALESAVQAGCRWLDLGAGARLHGGWIGKRPGEITAVSRFVVGCDLVIPHLRRHPNLTHRVGAGGDWLPFADGSFDVVTANMVLEHLACPEQVFREVARVLAPGGRFVFVTPHRGHPVVRTVALMVHPRWRSWMAHKWEGRAMEHIFHTYYRANTKREIEALARFSGLKIRELDRFSSFPIAGRLPLIRHLERCWIACLERPFGARWRSNILGVLEC